MAGFAGFAGQTKRPPGGGLSAACRSEEPERVGVVAGQHTLGLLIVFQRDLVGLAANTGLLVTTEGRVRRVCVIAVHPDPTSLDIAAYAVRQVGVAGPYAGTQA